MTVSVVIVDYGMGNLRSVCKAFVRLGCEAEISADPEQIRRATRLVLPGVGHFAQGMANLAERGLITALRERVIGDRVPLLGICLGVQLLSRRSEEGNCEGLGWIHGETIRFRPDTAGPLVRIPHIGWNTVAVVRPNPLVPDRADGESFYFVHSYHLSGCDQADVVATTEYGTSFVAAIHKGNIFGTQFHPEKSHRRGLRVLQRFLEAS
jgi:glutamine amidotransferase